MSIRDNIAYGCGDVTEEAIMNLAKRHISMTLLWKWKISMTRSLERRGLDYQRDKSKE